MFDMGQHSPSDAVTAAPQPDLARDAPLQQSALYALACTRLGAQVREVALSDRAVPGAQLLVRRFPLLGRVGLLSRPQVPLTHAMAAGLRKRCQVRHLLVNAETEESAAVLRRSGFWRIARPRLVAELALAPDPDAMAARLAGKWRNRLRHAQRQDLRLHHEIGPIPLDHWLFTAEAEGARNKGYQPVPAALVAALTVALPGAGHLFVARARGRALAAMLFLVHGRVATYQIGWTSPDGRARSAGNLLMWQAMTHMAERGILRLDLGLADAQRSPGLAHFKRGTGARVRPLGGSWLSSPLLPRLHQRPA